MIRLFLALIITLVGFTANAQLFDGTTRVAASCSRADVAAQIAASSAGDIVKVPNGSCAWTSGVSFSQIAVIAENYTPTPGGDTTRNVVITNNASEPLFTMTTGNNYHTWLAGMRIDEGTEQDNAVEVGGSGSKVALLSDMYFEGADRFGSAPVDSVIDWEGLGGVVWNTRFYAIGDPATIAGGFFHVKSPRAWTTASTMGSLDTSGNVNLYIEDSTCYDIHPLVDGDDNARVVFRYNNLDGCAGLTHGFTSLWGGRHLEYYNNEFSVTDTSPDRNISGRYIWLRAGTLVSTDNVVNSSSCTVTCYSPPDMLDIGDNTSPGSYPMDRQPGGGHDGNNYVVDPIYIWNDTGALAHTYRFEGSWGSIVQSGRDIFVNAGAKPGYSQYDYPHPARAAVEGGTSVSIPSRRYGGRGRGLFR